MSVSTEDFLKGIYQLKFDHKVKANSSNLAERLGITHAAVTDMARKLSAKGYINYQRYKEITLTDAGKKQALKVIRRHRLWELFLVEVLNIPVGNIHKEAEMLEHHTSDYLADKIDEYLGHPAFDPHGDPIPDVKGVVPESDNLPLTNALPGKLYIIDRIYHTNEKISHFYSQNNLYVGQKFSIEQKSESDKSITLTVDHEQLVVNQTIAGNIFVKET